MISYLSLRTRKAAAAIMFSSMWVGTVVPAYSMSKYDNVHSALNVTATGYRDGDKPRLNKDKNKHTYPGTEIVVLSEPGKRIISPKEKKSSETPVMNDAPEGPLNGGPTQPEMSSFKSVGTKDLVNLFTGDFNYNIPLMDVGGYPVNIYYSGGVGLNEDASWVGLGWNINPGSVSRNMRGVPDDFNGEDLLIQRQTMKPNLTWGLNLGVDIELVGIKNPFKGTIGASFGVSINNYLGPALDLGIKGTTGLTVGAKALGEKNAPTLGGSLSVNASSRNGVTFSPGISLTSKKFHQDGNIAAGMGLKVGTSFNSRTGVKAIQIAEQMTLSRTDVEERNAPSIGMHMASTSISFSKPSYTPSLRMPTTSTAYSGHFQGGAGIFGVYGSEEIEVYKHKTRVRTEDEIQKKPMIGFIYLDKSNKKSNAVLDFNRLNDNEVTPSTPVISATQYSYDVFSIQGEGTGGSIRAYRNDIGYMRDAYSKSRDENISLGVDIGGGHWGGNFNVIKTPSEIGDWNDGNKLRIALKYKEKDKSWENVYFRNPGETTVLHPSEYDKIGGGELVRYKLGGTKVSPTVEPVIEKFNKLKQLTGTVNLTSAGLTERKKRTQVTDFFTAAEATEIGLDKTIKSYTAGTGALNGSNQLVYSDISRVDGSIRKAHHLSQITVTESGGQRYVYGIPVYNHKQKDFTFTVAANSPISNSPDQVTTSVLEATTLHSGSKDGYLQITETPAFAHSFLLTGLLSTDYEDRTGNGISEDDYGSAVKFNYTKMAALHKWRTPLGAANTANFVEGKKTENKDDKGFVSYGERESWYLHSIESKSMIAFFRVGDRTDFKGVSSEFSGINTNDEANKKLERIDLYNKADLKKNGLTNAKPIKSVFFEYDYELCKNAPGQGTSNQGKLTLKKIYFTFNGRARTIKNQYLFNYGDSSSDNPDYVSNATDRWGTYKPSSVNPGGLKNSEYPYSWQDSTQKTIIHKNAAAWNLKKILLPSGGLIQVEYESDDYAFVQNRRAASMMPVVGFGQTNSSYSNSLYTLTSTSIKDHYYVFIKVPIACSTDAQVFSRYLDGISQLSFKLAVNMPKGLEFINSYATMEPGSYGIYGNDASNRTIWLKIKPVDGISPLSLTAVEFLREQLPGQAYKAYDVSESSGLKQVGLMFVGLIDEISDAFKNPVTRIRTDGKAKTVDVTKTFVRLNDPDGAKFGGGHRVKSVRLIDNWSKMNGENLYNSEYGQEYSYTRKELFNGQEREISSGVASYEPTMGGDENPFLEMIQVSNKVPLGPTSYGSVEMPFLDAFYPSPLVGYSKVTVRSINKNYETSTKRSRSATGKKVTEFYTAKEFPFYQSYLPFDAKTDLTANSKSLGAFFYKYAFDGRTLSQGFLVETNDMHGKMKSVTTYPEGDSKTPIHYTENFYKNTGKTGFDDKLLFANNANSATVSAGNMGIDIELMTDVREFSVKTTSVEVQGQGDLFPVVFPFWLPFIWPVVGETRNIYRAVTATKVVNYHSILDSVIVIDKGSQVTTKNLIYDSETGDLLVSRTNNEFKEPIYSMNLPAWWAYSGMSNSYKNTGAVYHNVNITNGKIVSGNVPNSILESGDVLYLLNPGTVPTDNCAGNRNLLAAPGKLLWVFDQDKHQSSLTNTTPDFHLMDSEGRLYNRNGVSFRIIRSGKKNMLDAKLEQVTLNKYPVVSNKLAIPTSSMVLSATAVEFKEKWKTDQALMLDVSSSFNPYRKGVLGNFRAYQEKVFYERKNEEDPSISTNLPVNGGFKNYSPYWGFDGNSNLVPTVNSSIWVFKTESTLFNSKGMELENKNALGVYSMAQYGFNNTKPVAIVNNSKYGLSFHESFETYDDSDPSNHVYDDYDEQLTQGSTMPSGDHHSLHYNHLYIEGAQVVKNNSVDGKAHSGNKMWKFNSGYQAANGEHQSDPNECFVFDQENPNCTVPPINVTLPTSTVNGCPVVSGIPSNIGFLNPRFHFSETTDMLISFWVRDACGIPCLKAAYDHFEISIICTDNTPTSTNILNGLVQPVGPIIEGWQKVEARFTMPTNSTHIDFKIGYPDPNNKQAFYVDDIRIHPVKAVMKSYVYDPVNLRLIAELDENNYARFYEYDEEGTLIRKKVETQNGIKMIQETRSAQQKTIDEF